MCNNQSTRNLHGITFKISTKVNNSVFKLNPQILGLWTIIKHQNSKEKIKLDGKLSKHFSFLSAEKKKQSIVNGDYACLFAMYFCVLQHKLFALFNEI